MSFPRYPEYKDSGVEWLGEVPAHWDVRRLKNIVEEPLKYGANESAELDDRTLPRFIRITDIDDRGGLRDETFKSLPLDVAEPYLLKEGDIILARSGATVGKSFIYSAQWGAACFAGYLIRVRLKHTTCLAQWLYYFCQTDEYWGYVVGTQIQSTIQNVSAEKYANLYLPLPTISEQTHIATFLDHETTKIDGLVAEQRRLMELLKEKRQTVISHAVTKGLNPDAPMKPSGIEWLGDIPAHWEQGGLTKFIGPIVDYRGRTPIKQEYGTFLITARNIKNGKINYDISEEYVDPESVKSLLQRGAPEIGDILFTMEAPLGQVAIIDRLDIALAQRIVKFRGKENVMIGNFLLLWLMSDYCQAVLLTLATGSTVLGIKSSKLGMINCLVPTYLEQTDIVEFVNETTNQFDVLIAEAQRAIDLLQERRTALISAAVTGQIDVRQLAESLPA